jgi:hypothetical protein
MAANGTRARVALRLRSLYAFRMPTTTPPYWLMGSLAGSSMARRVADAKDVLRLATEWAGMGVRDIKIEDAKGRVFDPQEFKRIIQADRT